MILDKFLNWLCYKNKTIDEFPANHIIDYDDGLIEVVFDKGVQEIGETCHIKDGKFYMSSYEDGIIEWNGEMYVHHWYLHRHYLGQLKYFVFEKDHPIKYFLKIILGKLALL